MVVRLDFEPKQLDVIVVKTVETVETVEGEVI